MEGWYKMVNTISSQANPWSSPSPLLLQRSWGKGVRLTIRPGKGGPTRGGSYVLGRFPKFIRLTGTCVCHQSTQYKGKIFNIANNQFRTSHDTVIFFCTGNKDAWPPHLVHGHIHTRVQKYIGLIFLLTKSKISLKETLVAMVVTKIPYASWNSTETNVHSPFKHL